jgi:hypothetical protein
MLRLAAILLTTCALASSVHAQRRDSMKERAKTSRLRENRRLGSPPRSRAKALRLNYGYNYP